MGKYIRAQRVDAEQIEFTDEAKQAVKSGTPTTAYGGHIKFEDGTFSVPIHLGEDAKLANEGDWIVKEEGTGKSLIVSNEQFEEDYFEEDYFEEDYFEEEEDDYEDADNEVEEPAGEEPAGEEPLLGEKKEETTSLEKAPETPAPPVKDPAEPVIETPAPEELPAEEPAAEEGKAE
jgi:hypothetical protein